uniref:Uncharacterized protein n=1 Tax=Neovison vison TaxID=452646 RepID=A0A8C7A600_NEOVI
MTRCFSIITYITYISCPKPTLSYFSKELFIFFKDFIYLFDRERSQVGREAGRGRGGSRLPTIKCVVLGDGAVGKTRLLISYTTNRFPSEYQPTPSGSDAVTVMTGGRPDTLGLRNTAGQEDSDRLGPLSYPQTDGYPVCFSGVSPSSFENGRKSGLLSCLLGPKLTSTTEKLAKNKQKPVTAGAAEKSAGGLKAVEYVVCSALTQKSQKNVPDKAILAALGPLEPRKSRSRVLQGTALQSLSYYVFLSRINCIEFIKN